MRIDLKQFQKISKVLIESLHKRQDDLVKAHHGSWDNDKAPDNYDADLSLFVTALKNALYARYREFVNPETGYLFPEVHEFCAEFLNDKHYLNQEFCLKFDDLCKSENKFKGSKLLGSRDCEKFFNGSKEQMCSDRESIRRLETFRAVLISRDIAEIKRFCEEKALIRDFFKNNPLGFSKESASELAETYIAQIEKFFKNNAFKFFKEEIAEIEGCLKENKENKALSFFDRIFKQKEEKESVVKKIENLCIDLNSVYLDSEGTTPLMFAAAQHDLELTQLLVEQGAKVDVIGYGRRTAFTQAIMTAPETTAIRKNLACNYVSILRLGDAYNSTHPDIKNYSDVAPAAFTQKKALLDFLIKNGAKVNAVFAEKENYSRLQTPLTFVARQGEAEIVDLLLEHGADVESRVSIKKEDIFQSADSLEKLRIEDNFKSVGKTALMFAVMHEHAPVCLLLMQAGANVLAKVDHRGSKTTPKDHAPRSDLYSVAREDETRKSTAFKFDELEEEIGARRALSTLLLGNLYVDRGNVHVTEDARKDKGRFAAEVAEFKIQPLFTQLYDSELMEIQLLGKLREYVSPFGQKTNEESKMSAEEVEQIKSMLCKINRA